MTRQLPLALALQHAPSLDDFIIGRNAGLIDALQRAIKSSGEALIYLFGPAGSGRSHLLQGQCAAAQRHGLQSAYLPLAERDGLAPEMLEGLEQLDLVSIDDVHLVAGDAAWENAVFALFNRCRDCGTRLLFSGDRGPAALPLKLADLRTRLAWGLTLPIHALDDSGRHQLLQSLAARRALPMPDDVARYLLERGPRHPRELVELVARLDHASLAERRRLTIPFVREHLQWS